MLQAILRRGARKAVAGTAGALVIGLVTATAAFADTSPSGVEYSSSGGQTVGTVNQGTTPQPCTPGSPAGGMTSPMCSTPGANGVLPATSGGNLPAQNNGGNEVLGASAGGGTLPKGTLPASATAPVTTKRLVGSLPFTGLDLALVAAVGLALAGLGLGLRRLAGAPQAS